MAESASGNNPQKEQNLLTLSEVSKRTEISMPTLQRYKKNYQDRIPSVGKGRKQRYPEEALDVFKQIKKENIKKRGRPPKKASEKAAAKKAAAKKAAGRKKAGKAKGSGSELLTLTRVAELTGISYPTLVRYVKDHGDRIPYEGEGRRRRYHPEAVDVFKQIRSETKRGRRKGTGNGQPKAGVSGDGSLARRVRALEQTQSRLEKQIAKLIKNLQKPLRVTIQRTGTD